MTTTTKTYWNYIVFMQTTLHVEIFLPFFFSISFYCSCFYICSSRYWRCCCCCHISLAHLSSASFSLKTYLNLSLPSKCVHMSFINVVVDIFSFFSSGKYTSKTYVKCECILYTMYVPILVLLPFIHFAFLVRINNSHNISTTSIT